ncbi:MAG: YolD-like family protein [Bacilli bacterium]
MRISEGNIFETMRLVLPEHRDVMAAWERERNRPESPTLSEDEIAHMHYILSEAIEIRARVRLLFFANEAVRVLEGVPTYDGRLRIVNADGVFPVSFERLIRVEEC